MTDPEKLGGLTLLLLLALLLAGLIYIGAT